MKLTKEGTDLIHEFESCRLEAYLCPANKWTIGWGNTYYADGSPVKNGDKITQAQADRLFEIIINRKVAQVRKVVPPNLNDEQFSALVSFVYNIGITKFKSSTLLKRVIADKDDPDIAYQFSRWINKGTSFENGLRRRRKAEAELYFS